ncbi:hypothetical protein M514_13129 [Trichuris suis]|uniref:Uncharacterized protein n=1 Tax=Trichuris suis TaxID=68888 RepID=A0A085LM01_9BILA|nr:hypothetical protein M513_13129 [Trichuris suis]KFD67540.1 hypothetical protein M514_13129 [Trichuris suis]
MVVSIQNDAAYLRRRRCVGMLAAHQEERNKNRLSSFNKAQVSNGWSPRRLSRSCSGVNAFSRQTECLQLRMLLVGQWRPSNGARNAACATAPALSCIALQLGPPLYLGPFDSSSSVLTFDSAVEARCRAYLKLYASIAPMRMMRKWVSVNARRCVLHLR